MGKIVKELMTEDFVAVHEIDRIMDVATIIAEDRETMLACVVDVDGKLRGIVTPKEMLKAVEVCEYGSIRHSFFSRMETLHILSAKDVGDIMDAPVSVREEDDVQKAINIMIDRGFYEVPVVNDAGVVIGVINYFHIISGSIDHCRKEEE
jgi:CBS domain-containing protein